MTQARIRFCEPLSLLPIVTRLRALFDLGADTSVIAQHFRRDLLLGRLVRKHPGLRVPGAWDGFELAVRAILGQQVSVAAASTLAGQIARKFGERLSVSDPGGLTTVFPTAEAMAGITLTGMPQARARAIRSLAQAVASGSIAFSPPAWRGDARGPGAHRRRGEWTAQYIAMRASPAGRFPVNDLVLLNGAGAAR
jgi:AraC family transcriptional regulator of adaptative response / DNA-3-methyladenine glycosylase II